MQAGDIVACTSDGFLGASIRYAQKRDGLVRWDINHVAALHEPMGDDWSVYQAESKGVTGSGLLSTITPGGRHFVIPFPDAEADRGKFLEYLDRQVGDEYSWMSVASCAVDIVLPDAICLRRSWTLICSGYLATGLMYAGYPKVARVGDIYTVMPAQLVEILIAA